MVTSSGARDSGHLKHVNGMKLLSITRELVVNKAIDKMRVNLLTGRTKARHTYTRLTPIRCKIASFAYEQTSIQADDLQKKESKRKIVHTKTVFG